MVYVLLFFTATVAFALQIRQYISLKTYTEDALAASNLASAVIDIQEYGINHNLIIKDPAHAYSIYQDALKVNMGLNDHWEDPTGMISGPVQVEQYIVYNVRGTEVEVTSFGDCLNTIQQPRLLEVQHHLMDESSSLPAYIAGSVIRWLDTLV